MSILCTSKHITPRVTTITSILFHSTAVHIDGYTDSAVSLCRHIHTPARRFQQPQYHHYLKEKILQSLSTSSNYHQHIVQSLHHRCSLHTSTHHSLPHHSVAQSQSPSQLRRKMPPKKEVASNKPMILGRPTNNVSMGIVGLPNVGKSTIFNALSKLNVPGKHIYSHSHHDDARDEMR
jgi:hypothetical protein